MNQMRHTPGDHGVPFHLLRRHRLQSTSQDMRDNKNVVRGLESVYGKTNNEELQERLSSFLPHLPGYIDAPGTTSDSLYGLIEKPPIGGRELAPLSDSSLMSFRLMPGSVPEKFKFMNHPPEKKKKHKKHKIQEEGGEINSGDPAERKHKKKKKEEGDKKKKKKDKKKKKIEQRPP
ncbi:mediator of RNA polymerase II transcription subunit 19-like isoform X2 [Rhopilema esculentum]|uniref:mediator of RNA polymerase II transcription subunit 19-like isoform X2 n=1 Tax=Rhopilema esculentum TaxID=499914 RepID=UPI0031E0F7F6